jgi:DNA helicase-2/ATP-dependent DNA helicase PcrA
MNHVIKLMIVRRAIMIKNNYQTDIIEYHNGRQDNKTQNQSSELIWQQEKAHLKECLEIIKKNIETYSEEYRAISAETKELYDNYRSSNPELHNNLVVGLDLKSQIERLLSKNQAALKNPYFGRIDYYEYDDNEYFSLYIGKNGIRKNRTENFIIDWRAPVSSIYYDSEIGESSYQTPSGETLDISLKLKRTYEISDSVLIDFYDSDLVTNDELLNKYLSKNKEVVLGEIIATIQKEQNEIIRDTPFHNVIVQGVAGSGKTTVAMHRISYILYNYKDRFKEDEFYIIGSNKMLLNYITGVLPNLDVYNVNQMTMQNFLLMLLDGDFKPSRGKYRIKNSFVSLKTAQTKDEEREVKSYKGSIHYIKALDDYLKQYVIKMVTREDIVYKDEVILTKEEIIYYLNFFEDKPMQEKIDLLNKQLAYRISSINEENMLNKETIKEEVKKFKDYFGNRSKKINLMDIYKDFLMYMDNYPEEFDKKRIKVLSSRGVHLIQNNLSQKKLDLYDLAMLTLIKKRLKLTGDFDYFRHIVIDEAQDFGLMIFYLLKILFPKCTYTIMGDVSQNIYYDSGMNGWDVLRNEIFNPDRDRFYVLAKSYRNTIEISEYAKRILSKCSFETYEIQPIIRHGKEVTVTEVNSEQDMVLTTAQIAKKISENGYDTTAIICRTIEEARRVEKLLMPHIKVMPLPDNLEDMTFLTGIMVLPIHMTKGLEFDGVIIWNPDENSYRDDDADAKLLYVAITRAMHELYIVYKGKLSKLLN